MRISQPMLLTFLLILVCGCSRTDQGRIVYSEREGVRVARIVGGPRLDGPMFEFVSELVLGIDEGEPDWQMFSGYPRLLVAPDGRLAHQAGTYPSHSPLPAAWSPSQMGGCLPTTLTFRG
jgi:hypothetical protein